MDGPSEQDVLVVHSSAELGCWDDVPDVMLHLLYLHQLCWAQPEDRRAAYWSIMTQQAAGVSALIIQRVIHDVQKHWPGAPNAGADSWLLTTVTTHTRHARAFLPSTGTYPELGGSKGGEAMAEDEGCVCMCQMRLIGRSCGHLCARSSADGCLNTTPYWAGRILSASSALLNPSARHSTCTTSSFCGRGRRARTGQVSTLMSTARVSACKWSCTLIHSLPMSCGPGCHSTPPAAAS